MGNCGNQFFQYAFARALQEKFGGELVIDYSLVLSDQRQKELSDNLLDAFNTVEYRYVTDNNLNPHKILSKLIDKGVNALKLKAYTKKTYNYCLFCAKHLEKFGIYYFSAAFFPFKYRWNKDFYVNGYFESPKYFKEIDSKIRQELMPKREVLDENKELYSIITRSQSVCISIKRYDIENSDTEDVYSYDISYFYNAIKYLKTIVDNPVWIVFSDNPAWCQQNFIIDGEVHYEREGNPIWEKMRLMSACKHFIIHSSTFSWWAQHLSKNPDKIVIVPVKWMQRDDQPIDIYEDHFIYMSNGGTIYRKHI